MLEYGCCNFLAPSALNYLANTAPLAPRPLLFVNEYTTGCWLWHVFIPTNDPHLLPPPPRKVKRHDLFVTMMVGERNSTVAGGAGIAATVRETLANGRVEDGGSEDDGSETKLLDSVDALVLARESGE